MPKTFDILGHRRMLDGKTKVPDRIARGVGGGPAAGATQSEHRGNPEYMKGIAESAHAGADVLVPDPSYYSNPNSAEHVRGFPNKNVEESSRSTERYALFALLGFIFLFALLKSS